MVKVLLVFLGGFIFNCKASDNAIRQVVRQSLFNEQKYKEESYTFEEREQKENEKRFWILQWPMDMWCPKTRP